MRRCATFSVNCFRPTVDPTKYECYTISNRLPWYWVILQVEEVSSTVPGPTPEGQIAAIRTLTAEEKSNLSSILNNDYFSSKNKMAGKTIISDCSDDGGRDKVMEKLRPYIDIDVYGRCGL